MSPDMIRRIMIPAILVCAVAAFFGGDHIATSAFQLLIFLAGGALVLNVLDVRKATMTVGDLKEMQLLMVEMRGIKHFIERWTADAGAWSDTAHEVDDGHHDKHKHEESQ